MKNEETKLPKFRKNVLIGFMSTNMYDEELCVKLEAYRVKTNSSWQWFIGGKFSVCGFMQKARNQKALNEIGSDLSKIKIL